MVNNSECQHDPGKERTSLPVTRDTKELLKKHGQMCQTWDAVIRSVVFDLENLSAAVYDGIPVCIEAQDGKFVRIGTVNCLMKGKDSRTLEGRVKIDPKYEASVMSAMLTTLNKEE